MVEYKYNMYIHYKMHNKYNVKWSRNQTKCA